MPLYGFVFLVALGVDYNIFLMSRVREESLVHGTRSGILRGLVATGGVITCAGLVLAATFAALGVIPILFLAQIAFIVAFGVLLDTFVVRSLLVPASPTTSGRRSGGRRSSCEVYGFRSVSAIEPTMRAVCRISASRAPVASQPMTSLTRFRR